VNLRRLDPRALDKVWGSPATEPWYPASSRKIGEVWFAASEEPRLLVKFIFTSGKLSVQVHPPDSAEGPGKTEMWHVLRAAPDARLALGFAQPLSRERLRAAAVTGEIEELLRWFAPQPGDTFHVPAGTVHAIGAGLALCEIQQHNDVTYRLYDYGRPRELHLDQALAVAHCSEHPGASVPVKLGEGHWLLADSPYFRTESIAVAGERPYVPGGQPCLLICIEGAGSFDGEAFAPGEVWLVPAGAQPFPIQAPKPARLLRTFVP
jgi:mannose-6-phosphate isomerase